MSKKPANKSMVSPRGGPTIWSRSRETAGCKQSRTGRHGDLWGRPMSGSGRFSADMASTQSYGSSVGRRETETAQTDLLVVQIYGLYVPEEDPPYYALKVTFFDQVLVSTIIKPFGIRDGQVSQTVKVFARGSFGYDPSDYEKMCLFADTPLIVNIQPLTNAKPIAYDYYDDSMLPSFFRIGLVSNEEKVDKGKAVQATQRGKGAATPPPTAQNPTRSPESITEISCCNVDILPLFLDQDSICIRKRLEPMQAVTPLYKKSWNNLPMVTMTASVTRRQENDQHHRLLRDAISIKITIIGAYNLLIPYNTECYYTAATKIPIHNPMETEMTMYSEGFMTPRNFNNMGFFAKWETLRLQGEPFTKSDDKVQYNYDEVYNPEKFDLPYYLKRSPTPYNTLWASFHRSLLIGQSDKKMWDHIRKWKWPIEVHFYGDLTGGLSLMAFMDLFQFCYPGVSKLTLAVPLQWFSPQEMLAQCNCGILLLPNDKTLGSPGSQTHVKAKKEKTDSAMSSSVTDDDKPITGGDGKTAFVMVEVQLGRPLVPESIPPFISRCELKQMLNTLEPQKGKRACKGRGQLVSQHWNSTLNMAVKALRRVPHHGLTDICVFNRQLSESRTRVELFTSFWMEAALYINNNFVVTQYLHSESAFEELLKIGHVCLMKNAVDTLVGDDSVKIDPTLRAARQARQVNDLRHAVELHLQVVVQNATDSNAWRELSTCLRDVDRSWAAVCLNKALSLDIRHPLSILSKACMVFEEDMDAAEPFFTSLLTLFPFWPVAYIICIAYCTAREYFRLADVIKESLNLLNAEHLTSDLNFPRAWERELGDFWEAPQLLPGMSQFYYAADLLLRIRAIRMAEVCLGLALCEKGETTAYFHLVALCCRLNGDYANAICHLQIGIEMFGQSAALRSLEGECYHQLGDVPAAMQALEKAKGANSVHNILLSLPSYEPQQVRTILVDMLRRTPTAYGWMALAEDWLLRAQMDADLGGGDPQKTADTSTPAMMCAEACAVQALKFDRRAGRAWALLAKLVKPQRRRMHCSTMAVDCGYVWMEETDIRDLKSRSQESICHLLGVAIKECRCDMCEPLQF